VSRHVEATTPYAWPYDGVLDADRLALVVAGAQVGWVARSRRAAEVASTIDVLRSTLRSAGATVVLVRHGGRAGRHRSRPLPPWVGDPDWPLAMEPAASELVVDAGGIDGFFAGPLDEVLRSRGIDHLALGGFGAEAAVDSTLRSANDRGYECLVLTDACAPFDDATGAHALASVTMSGGIFGAVGTAASLLSALHPAPIPTLTEAAR
jgi:nicotinamidase-related amidase